MKKIAAFFALLAFPLLGVNGLASTAGDGLPNAKNKKTATAPTARTATKPKTATQGKTTAHVAAKLPAKANKSAMVVHPAVRNPNPPHVASTASRAKAVGLEWVRSLQNWLYPVKISTSAGGTRLFETHGLAVENTYLLVPLDSVLTAWLSRSDLHFFVNDTVEAHVADLDLAGNIAILKVDGAFPSSLSRTQIRTDLPAPGEAVAAAESRESIHGGPRFVSVLRDGENVRYQYQLNGTLGAGGFIFDRVGNLVSVVPANAAPERNENVWASSTQAIVELIHKQDTPRPASVSGVEERHNQLVTWQEHWTRSFVTDQKSLMLQNLECHSSLASITESTVATKIRQMNTMDCESLTPVSLGGGYVGGMQLKSGNIVLRTPTLSDPDGLKLARTFGSDYFADLSHHSSEVNLLTVSDCQEANINNQRGHLVHVRYCTSALKTDKGLSDTVLALSSVDSGSHAYVLAAHLKGFDQNNTKKVMEALIENGESLK